MSISKVDSQFTNFSKSGHRLGCPPPDKIKLLNLMSDPVNFLYFSLYFENVFCYTPLDQNRVFQ